MTYLSQRMREIREEEAHRSGIDMDGVAEWFLATDWPPRELIDFRKEQRFPSDYVSYFGRGA